MRMQTLAILLLLTGCWNSDTPEERRQATLNRLDFMERNIHADLYRAQTECKATAIEFTDPALTEKCIEAYRAQADIARASLRDIRQRRAELTGTVTE